MNTVNNKRRRDSVEKIEKVFLEILQTKDIEQISVSDICKMANINRTTFYSNYVDIYDLVDKIKTKLMDEFYNLYDLELTNKKHSYDFLKLFRHIKDNQIFYKSYFKLNLDLLVDDSLLLDKNDFIKWFGSDKMGDYHVTFFKAGLNAIIKRWLNNGCVESPEEINDILISEYKNKNLIIRL